MSSPCIGYPQTIKRTEINMDFITRIIFGLLKIACRIDSREMDNIPLKGPAIIIFNHINFLEVPLLYTHLLPRHVYGIAKKETWKNPFFRFLANRWNGIPLDREGSPVEMFRTAGELLKKEEAMLVIAPEGTRSNDGKLRKGKPGVVLMAVHAGVPVIPVAHYGGEKFWDNIKRFRRTPFTIKVGDPFVFEAPEKMTKEKRRELTDFAMRKLAELLPEEYRGVYNDPVAEN